MDIYEYLDEMNELAIELEELGDVDALERLHRTVVAIGMQVGMQIVSTQEELDEYYLDTVPP